MFTKEFDDLAIEDISQLVANGIPEGRRLEYKRDHYGRNDSARKEFAADVTAMANSAGGYLLIGVDEEDGIASRVVGVQADNADALILAIQSSLRASTEPPLISFRVRWLPLQDTKGVILIQIDRSWTAPHRVVVGGSSQFFIRTENGKHPMSVAELRQSFLFGSNLQDRIKSFRQQRIEIFAANEGPFEMDLLRPILILHLLPRASFVEDVDVILEGNAQGVPPLGAMGYNQTRSLEGLVSYSGPEFQTGQVRAYSIAFRTGIVEAVAAQHTLEKNGMRFLRLNGLEQEVISLVNSIRGWMRQSAISPPYYLAASLIGVRGLSATLNEHTERVALPFRRERLVLPELQIDEASWRLEAHLLLRPMFDLLWNAFGHEKSPNFRDDGTYIRR